MDEYLRFIKRTFDTEEKIVISGGEINSDGAEFIINPYDEYGVEEAIQIRDSQGGEVTVVSVGSGDAEKQLRTALAMGADKAVLINIEDDLEIGDEFTTAKILAEFLEDKEADLIFAGNVAIDGGSGQVGPRVADLLGIPYVTTITKIEIEGRDVNMIRDVEGSSETIEASLPLLVTAQQGLNEPRYPSLPGIMKAKKNRWKNWKLMTSIWMKTMQRQKRKPLTFICLGIKKAAVFLKGSLRIR